MTEGQIRFQTIMENQRHNLEMEKLGQREVGVKERQVDVSQQQADTALFQAETNRRLEKLEQRKFIWNEIFQGASLWNSGVSNAINFVKAIGGGLFK